MKIYVAGASSEVGRAVAFIARVRALGIEVTHDWTVEVLKDRYSKNRVEDALTDLRGVASADLLVFLAPEPPSGTTGGGFEAGAAYVWGKPIFASGSAKAHEANLFGALVQEFDGDEVLLEYLAGLSKL